ncbi:MAG: hypothetical protein CFH21_00869 [Alphaproteobacteria bacterium MarineAlpha5_Bin11]|nr:succinate dehydrogenase, cytochrome b556 subunit [Pelagibacteraceae bacterium]PPR43221.1 MAG: hypothetical protein CFH21_00869 [Alphaproteobacteria bacterium MarineAlpha5_Bin11]PPR51434.1 MAG: hypothetical protein CFH20_00627 [Alphaproteobacteria bacterium MarineAlpha5_Bin10]|tara:strand:+ start:869 stop:1261 length:393 start_codon:yes stop_codon:yes gene_type:complete
MNKQKFPRPLSPHLSIHKGLQTAILSITHRITGGILNLGLLIIVIWIFLAALGQEYFKVANLLLGTFLGRAVLFLWSLAIIYHLLNGIRYLFWSIGYGLQLRDIHISGYFVLIISIVGNIILWYLFEGVT